MKLLNTIAVCLFFSLIIISCGDDDPMDEPEVLGLDGEWKLTSLNVDLTSETTFFGEGVTISSLGTGQNMSYILNLDSGNFTTMGGYGLKLSTTSSLDPTVTELEQMYSDVSGSGTYTNTDTEITVEGQFFEFEVDGVSYTEATGPTTANYEIDGNVLTITQDIEETTSTLGVESTTKANTESVWTRQ